MGQVHIHTHTYQAAAPRQWLLFSVMCLAAHIIFHNIWELNTNGYIRVELLAYQVLMLILLRD